MKLIDSDGTKQKIYVEDKDIDLLLCTVISAMVTSNTKNVDAKKKELVESIDVFDSDFGRT